MDARQQHALLEQARQLADAGQVVEAARLMARAGKATEAAQWLADVGYFADAGQFMLGALGCPLERLYELPPQQRGSARLAATWYMQAQAFQMATAIYLGLHERQSAERCYESCMEQLQLQPTYTPEYRHIAADAIQCAHRLKHIDFTLDYALQDLIETGPLTEEEAQGFVLLSRLYEEHEQLENAQEVLERAVKRFPQFAEAQQRLTAIKMTRKGAETDYERVLNEEREFRGDAMPGVDLSLSFEALPGLPDLPPLPPLPSAGGQPASPAPRGMGGRPDYPTGSNQGWPAATHNPHPSDPSYRTPPQGVPPHRYGAGQHPSRPPQPSYSGRPAHPSRPPHPSRPSHPSHLSNPPHPSHPSHPSHASHMPHSPTGSMGALSAHRGQQLPTSSMHPPSGAYPPYGPPGAEYPSRPPSHPGHGSQQALHAHRASRPLPDPNRSGAMPPLASRSGAMPPLTPRGGARPAHASRSSALPHVTSRSGALPPHRTSSALPRVPTERGAKSWPEMHVTRDANGLPRPAHPGHAPEEHHKSRPLSPPSGTYKATLPNTGKSPSHTSSSRPPMRTKPAPTDHSAALPVPPERLSPGTVFASRYQLSDCIGRGGMAVVFRAFDKLLQEEVALKVFRPFGEDDTSLQRFKQELKLSRRLSHPHVAKLFDIGHDMGYFYISMELLLGQNLERCISDPALQFHHRLRFLLQASEGLAYAHEHGVIHRDVKSSNIFITNQGQAKLLDFGLAKVEKAPSLTDARTILGTALYISPEQIRDFRTITPLADLYSLGVVAYELFTGRLPFVHDELIPLLMMQIEQPPPPPRAVNPQLPPALEGLILRLLNKDPNQRYADAKQLAAHLKRLIAGLR